MISDGRSQPNSPTTRLDSARVELDLIAQNASLPAPLRWRRITEIAAAALQVERAGIWFFAANHSILTLTDLFERSSAVHSSGTTLQVADFPRYFEALLRQGSIQANKAFDDPLTSEMVDVYLGPLGITSMLDAIVNAHDRVVGVVCHEHTGPPRNWTPPEREFVSFVAEAVSRLVDTSLSLPEALPEPNPKEQQLMVRNREMAAGVGHDFRNLLTIILGHAELLKRKPELSASSLTLVETITAAAERGAVLASELMQSGSVGNESTRVVNVAEVIARFLPMLRAAVGERYPIESIPSETADFIVIDPAHLERILLNFAVNARDAMPNGGPIRIAVVPELRPDAMGEPRAFVKVCVTDRGTGIPPELLERIFEPYLSTKPKERGTGLGLAVIKEISQRFGGGVSVHSEVGVGSTFEVSFPRIASRASAKTLPALNGS